MGRLKCTKHDRRVTVYCARGDVGVEHRNDDSDCDSPMVQINGRTMEPTMVLMPGARYSISA